MKHCLVTLAALLVAASTYAQGTVVFNNKVTGSVDAIVMAVVGGSTVAADASYMAQLYAAAPGATLAPVGDPIPFRTGNGQGYLNATGRDTSRTIPGVAESGTAQAKMVAWASSLGATYEIAKAANSGGVGESAVLPAVATGGGLTPAQNLIGLQGFTISAIQAIPEPAIAALGLLGAGLLLIRRKK